MSVWEERAARNEALFREVNEQVVDLRNRQGGVAPGLVILCECSDELCTERISLSYATYEDVRSNPRRFFVVPGHENGFEHVVAHAPGYSIVEKEGRAGRIAEEHDPRT